MATREYRLAEFITDRLPTSRDAAEVLCSDHVGTYSLPFPCSHDGSRWRNLDTGEELATFVVGWREWKSEAADAQFANRPSLA
jgi:hypothetical protein